MANIFENLFSWGKVRSEPNEKKPESFVPEIHDDGSLIVAEGGSYGTYVDLMGSTKTEAELVSRYREMAEHLEVDGAIDDVVNEAIVTDEDFIIRLDSTHLKDEISPEIKARLEDEFEEALDLLDFQNMAHDIFKRWYIDGRLYYHAIIDEKNMKAGIKELRYIDPRKIRKVREIETVNKNNYSLQKTKEEYFIYNERGFTKNVGNTFAPDTSQGVGIKISTDAIVYCNSGVLDQNNNLVLSHLNKAIKPLNQLRTLEDAVVIYRISRAPERRIFYIDVGNLPKIKAEQYLRDVMVKHKNRLVYDANTGEIRDDRKYMTMMEDYWFPRRDGGRGTEVTTLPPGQNLGELADVEYFQKKLYKSLNVPISRLEPDLGMTLGRASEISRDEVKFSKFVTRCRNRFNKLFLQILKKNLILKKVILPEEWPSIERRLRFEYRQDNHFTELKNLEILTGRLQVLALVEPYIGRFVSNDTIRREVLFQDDDIIEHEDKKIAEEIGKEQFKPAEEKMMEKQAEIQMMMQPEPEPEEEPEEEEEEESLGHPTTPPPGKKNGEEKKPVANKQKADKV